MSTRNYGASFPGFSKDFLSPSAIEAKMTIVWAAGKGLGHAFFGEWPFFFTLRD